MSRVSKVLPFDLALAVVALAIFAASCNSTNTQYRIVNAMAFSPQTDIDIYVGAAPPASPTFPGVGLGSTEPGSGYQKGSSGSQSLEVFQTGTTTNPYINSTLNLGSGNQYTVVLAGNSAQSGSTYPFGAQVVQDTNPTPTSGDVEFRILDASPSTPSADVYVGDPTFGCCPSAAKIASGLSYPTSGGSGNFNSGYVNVGVPTSNSLGVWITYAGQQTVIASTTYTVSAGNLYTVVLVDQSSGGFPPQLLQLTP